MTQEPYEIEWKNYYKILNVTINATLEEIKKNYRHLAKYYHPDNNPNNLEAEAKFKEINEAYMILGDNNRRQKYDYFYKNIYKNEQSTKNEQNTGFNPYENLNNAFLLTMKLYVLEGQLTNHKAKQAIGAGLTVSGIAGLYMQMFDYLNAIQNNEDISKLTSVFTFISSALLSGGLYTLYKESKFDTIEHLQKMSELEQELRRTLRF